MNQESFRLPAVFAGTSAWTIGAIAGFMGGAIEVGWVVLYQQLTGHQAAAVARGIAQSLIPNLATGPAAIPLGIAIHTSLAVLLGMAIVIFVRNLLPRIVGTVLEPVVVVGMLIGVWAINFLVVLPAINPAFVTLVPYGASLVSKVLFGFAAAFVFWCAGRLHATVKDSGQTSNVR